MGSGNGSEIIERESERDDSKITGGKGVGGVADGSQQIWGGPMEQEDRGNSRLLAVMAVIQIPVPSCVQLLGLLSGAGSGVWWFLGPQRGRGVLGV